MCEFAVHCTVAPVTNNEPSMTTLRSETCVTAEDGVVADITGGTVVIVNAAGDAGPPVGFVTTTCAVPTVVTRLAGTEAVKDAELITLTFERLTGEPVAGIH